MVMLKLIDTNKNGKLNPLELIEFEKTNSLKLPEDYKRFILEQNGGEPKNKHHRKTDYVVSRILGWYEGEYYESIFEYIDTYQNRIPLGTFPIASDPFGNLFIMSLSEDSYGKIFFWDHEGELEYYDGHYIDNCYDVSDSFTEFIQGLGSLD